MNDNTVVTIIHLRQRWIVDHTASFGTVEYYNFNNKLTMHCTLRNVDSTVDRLKSYGHWIVRVYV